MTRDEAIAALTWNSGGWSIGNLASHIAWSLSSPRTRAEDIPSIVAVTGPPEKYTDDELIALAAFGMLVTADYDTRWKVRMGANLLLFDKPEWRDDGLWMRKKSTWESGSLWSPTLDEAIAFMHEAFFR